MRLQAKLSFSIVALLVVTVIVISFFTIKGVTQSMLAQTEQDGLAIAQVLAHASSFAQRVPKQVENVLGEQMAVEARITANLVAIAIGRAGMSAQEVSGILQSITDSTVLNEFWISDQTGRVEFTNTDIDFTFESDPAKQPQAYIFYQLLSQTNGVVKQGAQKREIDARLFKYVGVSGIDQPRIVQVGYEANVLDELSRDINIQKLVDELTGQGNVAAIRILDSQKTDIAVSGQPVGDIGTSLSVSDMDLLNKSVSAKEPRSSLKDNVLRVATPIIDGSGNLQQVAIVYLTTDNVQAAIRGTILRNIIVSLAVVLLGVLVSFVFSNGITRPIRRLTSAAPAMEKGESIEDEILRLSQSQGKDEVAALSRVFAKMAAEVKARETKLKKQVAEMKIEIDQSKKARQVAEITETDYFQNLKQKAKEMREKKGD